MCTSHQGHEGLTSSPPSSGLTPAASLESPTHSKSGVLTGVVRFYTLSGVAAGRSIQAGTGRLGVRMAANREGSAGRLFTCIASVVTVAVIALLLLLLYARWAEVKSAKALELVSALGGVGTFLALIWLICGHFRQVAQFRAQIKSAYEGSLQPTIVFRNTGAVTG